MSERFVDVEALGALVRIELPEQAPEHAQARLRQLWARCLPGAAGAPEPAATIGDEISWDDDEAAYTAITQAVTHAAIDARAGEVFMIHAGAVCHPETGASLVFAAPGGTGKTTLSARAGQRWGYVTDETVAIFDEDGRDRILPYPKPLSRRVIGRASKIESSPDDLGLVHCDPTPWVAGMAVLERADHHCDLTLSRLPLSEAMVRLAPETSSLALLDNPLRRLAGILERAGGLMLLRYSEAEQLDEMVDGVLGTLPEVRS